MILSAENLSIGYKKALPVLSGLDFSLSPGELVCLMGPNGSGKTTLLRTVSGLLPPISGKIELDGSDLVNLSASERAKMMSLVLTDPINTGAMTGYDVVQMGRYPHQAWFAASSKTDREISDNALKLVGAQGFSNKPLYELSDGQRQKILIGRAIAQDCQVMILDEPNSHLDLNNRVEIMNVLKTSTRDNGKAVLMATHELDLALQMADRIWLISEEGRLVSGIPEDLVLTGVIDRAFTLKGFDLRTGRVEHQKGNKSTVSLKGEGHLFLWTKNAIERTGASVSENAQIQISIESAANSITWRVTHNSDSLTFNSIEQLLSHLQMIFIK